jgi:catabolite regulation protein CreA
MMGVARVECVAKDLLVASIQQPVVLNVGCLIASITKPSCNPWGEIGVNEKPHAGRASGSSRS